VSDFVGKVLEVNPEIRFDHSLILSETIVAKFLPGQLKNVLDEVMKTDKLGQDHIIPYHNQLLLTNFPTNKGYTV
jgi:hypothetical protein